MCAYVDETKSVSEILCLSRKKRPEVSEWGRHSLGYRGGQSLATQPYRDSPSRSSRACRRCAQRRPSPA